MHPIPLITLELAIMATLHHALMAASAAGLLDILDCHPDSINAVCDAVALAQP